MGCTRRCFSGGLWHWGWRCRSLGGWPCLRGWRWWCGRLGLGWGWRCAHAKRFTTLWLAILWLTLLWHVVLWLAVLWLVVWWLAFSICLVLFLMGAV